MRGTQRAKKEKTGGRTRRVRPPVFLLLRCRSSPAFYCCDAALRRLFTAVMPLFADIFTAATPLFAGFFTAAMPPFAGFICCCDAALCRLFTAAMLPFAAAATAAFCRRRGRGKMRFDRVPLPPAKGPSRGEGREKSAARRSLTRPAPLRGARFGEGFLGEEKLSGPPGRAAAARRRPRSRRRRSASRPRGPSGSAPSSRSGRWCRRRGRPPRCRG